MNFLKNVFSAKEGRYFLDPTITASFIAGFAPFVAGTIVVPTSKTKPSFSSPDVAYTEPINPAFFPPSIVFDVKDSTS